MADKLHFSLVSPEAELFSGDVDQVDVPGSEGDLGILPMARRHNISSKADLQTSRRLA